jgi:hypothetical protein
MRGPHCSSVVPPTREPPRSRLPCSPRSPQQSVTTRRAFLISHLTNALPSGHLGSPSHSGRLMRDNRIGSGFPLPERQPSGVKSPHKQSQDIDSIASRLPEMGKHPVPRATRAALTNREVEHTIVFRRLFPRTARCITRPRCHIMYLYGNHRRGWTKRWRGQVHHRR